MPLMRYFVYVGGALLALLLIANACLPAYPVNEAIRSADSTDRSVIRIHSDRKLPERVVFDTSRPTVAPTPAPASLMAQVAPPTPPKVAAPPLKAEVREAFAQANPVHAEPKRKRKSVARNYAPPRRILVAQQPSFSFFGNIW
ncbi:MAG TPA: hypothetical protein VFL62_15665 [Bradyrhizobium sp.]|uniref:hypothetical protein n=1 Tax=Bradyrhizobium sp. TaxID=376 RepID=UPI002D803EF6|nr:hypothetical protein [Bradyrhizobium sp.]HET7887661.1 hypothetical protein [Bradyrhizobium sp.]